MPLIKPKKTIKGGLYNPKTKVRKGLIKTPIVKHGLVSKPIITKPIQPKKKTPKPKQPNTTQQLKNPFKKPQTSQYHFTVPKIRQKIPVIDNSPVFLLIPPDYQPYLNSIFAKKIIVQQLQKKIIVLTDIIGERRCIPFAIYQSRRQKVLVQCFQIRGQSQKHIQTGWKNIDFKHIRNVEIANDDFESYPFFKRVYTEFNPFNTYEMRLIYFTLPNYRNKIQIKPHNHDYYDIYHLNGTQNFEFNYESQLVKEQFNINTNINNNNTISQSSTTNPLNINNNNEGVNNNVNT